MRTTSTLLIFLFSFTFVIPLQANKPPASTFRLLILGDTKDENIRDGVKNDINNIKELATNLAKATNCRIKIKTLKDEDLTLVNFRTLLQETRVRRDDVLWFYYSGHGGRHHTDSSVFPKGYFTLDNGEAVNFRDFLDKLLLKHARLTIAMLDCCNSYPNQSNIIGGTSTKSGDVPFDWNKARIQLEDLFLKRHGFIVLAAASPGQFSYSILFSNDFEKIVQDIAIAEEDKLEKLQSCQQGVFTGSFIESLETNLKNGPVTWNSLFNFTKTFTEAELKELQNRQHSYCDHALSDYKKWRQENDAKLIADPSYDPEYWQEYANWQRWLEQWVKREYKQTVLMISSLHKNPHRARRYLQLLREKGAFKPHSTETIQQGEKQ